jgi:hypothetical protein
MTITEATTSPRETAEEIVIFIERTISQTNARPLGRKAAANEIV